ncbi:hypothetical protein GCM10023168_01940 [Fodinibacter luteus]|uniref:Uncharacterized protein n=1 Tax=Fodinibacter luteus TaxID=552064 RepID=A0ABP8JWI5_9MICO
MRSPSSLIFIVLLGIWAAYFAQYWVRRRDHLATARSVEQFTEAMRVLERRDALPATDLSEPAPRSYAVHPARSARPQVLVKRAVAAEPTGPLTVTSRVADTGGGGDGDGGSTPRPARPAGGTRPATGSGPVRPGRTDRVPPARPRLRPSRRVRGLLVLASLAELLVIVPLVVLAFLPVWALAPAVGAVAATMVYLRSGVRAEQATARAHRRRLAELERRRTSAPVVARPSTEGTARRAAPGRPQATGASSAADAVSGRAVVGVTASGHATAADGAGADEARGGPVPASAGATGSTTGAVATGHASEATASSGLPAGPVVAGSGAEPAPPAEPAAEVMVPILDEDDLPLTWDPVPVPRPTYTMKAKAAPREVAPAAVTPDPVPVERVADSEDAAYDERRVAGA